MTDQPPPTEPAPAGRIRLGPSVWIRSADLSTRAVRSAGPGGQNVNKRATKVEMRIAVGSIPLSDRQRRRLRRLAGSRLNDADEVVIASDANRSQRRNHEDCLSRLRELVNRALVEPKKRIPTRPTRASKERWLESKRRRSESLKRRRPPGQD